jgi:hypothetical protein
MAHRNQFVIRNDLSKSLFLNIEPEGAFFPLGKGEEVSVFDLFTTAPVTVKLTNSDSCQETRTVTRLRDTNYYEPDRQPRATRGRLPAFPGLPIRGSYSPLTAAATRLDNPRAAPWPCTPPDPTLPCPRRGKRRRALRARNPTEG